MPTPDAPSRKRCWLHLATIDITPSRRHRDYDSRRYHLAPDPRPDGVKQEKQ